MLSAKVTAAGSWINEAKQAEVGTSCLMSSCILGGMHKATPSQTRVSVAEICLRHVWLLLGGLPEQAAPNLGKDHVLLLLNATQH